MEEGWLQVWCYLYRGAIISDMSDDPVPHSDRPASTMQLYQTSMLGSWIHLRLFVKCCSIKQGIWSVTNPSDMPTGRMPLAQGYKTCWVPSWTPSWIYQILNDVLIAPLGCYKDSVCSSKISKIKLCLQMSGAYQSEARFSYIFCYKLPSWPQSCLHSFPIFIWLQAKCLLLDSNFIAYDLRKK